MVRKQVFNKPESEILLEAEEKIALLTEQVETLTRELYEQAQVSQLYLQELENTNYELNSLELELQSTIGLKICNLHQSKALAKKILAKQLPLRESLAELLSAIYNVPVAPDELEETDNPTPSIPSIKKTLVQNEENKFTEFKFQVNELRVKFNRLKTQVIELQAKSSKTKELRRLRAEEKNHQSHTLLPI